MSKELSLEEKRKLLAEAHQKMVEKIEQARKEYVETKRKLFPELVAPTPAEASRIIAEQQKRIKELEEKLALYEKGEAKK